MATIDDFEKIDIRVGQVLEAELIPDGKYSTHKLKINFGDEVGIKQSCARLLGYNPKTLVGKQVLGVVNFPARQIGKNVSEVLTLGVPNEEGESCILVIPERVAKIGSKLY